MNNYKLLLIGFIFISSFTLQAQDAHDKNNRAVMALTYLPEYTYETLDGDAAAKLILSAFKITKSIPQINIVGSIKDRATIEKLVLQLKQLLDNPPTWDELLVLEKDRLLQEDKALRRISKYKTVAE
jgi:hypothetical protein